MDCFILFEKIESNDNDSIGNYDCMKIVYSESEALKWVGDNFGVRTYKLCHIDE